MAWAPKDVHWHLFFAKQLVDHLLHNHPIMPDADVQRFKRILSIPRP